MSTTKGCCDDRRAVNREFEVRKEHHLTVRPAIWRAHQSTLSVVGLNGTSTLAEVPLQALLLRGRPRLQRCRCKKDARDGQMKEVGGRLARKSSTDQEAARFRENCRLAAGRIWSGQSLYLWNASPNGFRETPRICLQNCLSTASAKWSLISQTSAYAR